MKVGIFYDPKRNLKEKYNRDYFGRDTNDAFFAVKKALENLGYNIEVIKVNFEVFDRLKKLRNRISLVFNTCDEGFLCESRLEPHIPALLDMFGIKYTGSDFITLAMCLDKGLTKKILIANNIPTAPFIYPYYPGQPCNLNYPLIVKPAREDGSIGIKEDSVVYNEEQLAKKSSEIVEFYEQSALVEEFIDGGEFNVAILGNEKLESLPVAEIKFNLPDGYPKICSYDAKWDESSEMYNGTPPECPAKISKKLGNKLKEAAFKAYKAMNVRGYGRVDFRTKGDNIYVLEVNPNPDISPDAGLARCAKAAGLSYNELIGKIVSLGVEK